MIATAQNKGVKTPLLNECVGFKGILKAPKTYRIALQVLILAALILVGLSGCAAKIEYKEVLVPQKCEVTKKYRPAQTGDILGDFKGVLVYTEMLESDLAVCLGESIGESKDE